MRIVKEFTKGFTTELPPFRLVLGLCPSLAVTTQAENGLGMGMATPQLHIEFHPLQFKKVLRYLYKHQAVGKPFGSFSPLIVKTHMRIVNPHTPFEVTDSFIPFSPILFEKYSCSL